MAQLSNRSLPPYPTHLNDNPQLNLLLRKLESAGQLNRSGIETWPGIRESNFQLLLELANDGPMRPILRDFTGLYTGRITPSCHFPDRQEGTGRLEGRGCESP